MKINTILINIIFLSLCFGCNSKMCLEKRTNKLIEKSFKSTDTIFLYSVAFNEFNLVWYYNNNFLYSFWVKPFKTIKNKKIEAKNIILSNDSINIYFSRSIFKDIECFKNMLDGEWIKLYVKGENTVMSSIDTQCLFKNKYSINSFPYKFQYDFSKIWKPREIEFKKLYEDIQNE